MERNAWQDLKICQTEVIVYAKAGQIFKTGSITPRRKVWQKRALDLRRVLRLKTSICQKHCPEIVKGFCDADDICYGNMHPRISWDRTKTIGHGDGICDFKVRIK